MNRDLTVFLAFCVLVPCTPRNVVPTVDCSSAALVVSWTSSAGGQQYTATVQDSNGLSTTCQSTGSQCNVTGLRCGQLYYVNVTASDNLCSSPPSATVNTNSGTSKHIQTCYSIYSLYSVNTNSGTFKHIQAFILILFSILCSHIDPLLN